ncbi:MAG TPA: YfiR/HmsC family protein, partial [Azonexus sp.]|nr:YfiR/HmsC family protein [Azonexus sp.]
MHTNALPRSALAHLRSYALCLLLSLISVAAAAQEGNLEAKVKAAYLYHLTKFVDWPALPNDVLRICVQGDEADR